jgi:TrpR-related protein YerC/YecD
MPGKVKYHELTQKQRKKFLGDFYSIVAELKTRDEVKRFFKDLLTLSETVMISRRIQIALMLLDGYTQEEVKDTLKVGFNNIAQVERWLNNGFGGYKKAIQVYKKKSDKVQSRKEKKVLKHELLHRYPHHRFLLELIK